MTWLAGIVGAAVLAAIYGSTPLYLAKRRPARTDDRVTPPPAPLPDSQNPMSSSYAPSWAVPLERRP